jgi:hypothetical protein
MLDENVVAELIEKLRARALDDLDSASDVLDVLRASYWEDAKQPVNEIAKTVCEILEPERIGKLKWLTCRICTARLKTETEHERGYCDLH